MSIVSPSLLQSAIPHAIILVVGPANDASSVATVAETLAVFRILRALKMVHVHYQQWYTNDLDHCYWWSRTYAEDFGLNPTWCL